MKRAFALLLACLVLGAWPASAGQVYNLKFNLNKPNTDPQFAWFTRLFADVEKATNGAVKTQIYSSEALGASVDIIEQASMGDPVIADCDVGYLANYVPDIAAAQAPYILEAPEEGLILWNTELFQGLRRQLEDKGLHLISMNYDGMRSLFTKVPIASRDDVGRLKIRCAPNPLWMSVVQVLNGNPTPVPMSETYQALSQGVVDGAEGFYSMVYSQKWHETLKHLTVTEHITSFCCLVMSSEIYRSMPDDVRAALDKTAYKYMEEFLALTNGVQQEYLKKLVADGVKVSQIDKTPFINAAPAAVAKYFPDWSKGIYEKMKAEIASGKKK